MLKLYPKIYIYITAGLIFFAVLSISINGLNLGPSFTGGTSVLFTYENNSLLATQIEEELLDAGFDGQLRKTSEGFLFRTNFLEEAERLTLLDTLSIEETSPVIKNYTTYGPSISKELIGKSIFALILASFFIIFFVMFAFRQISNPLSSWKYGITALSALAHDLIILVGAFSLLSFAGVVINELFIMALLATIGYSVNDTLVIFDRIREKLNAQKKEKQRSMFNDSVQRGVQDSVRRSIYTSVTTSIPLILLFVFVPAVQWFALALLIGVIVGTYSSLFFAPSMLILWNKLFAETDKSLIAKTEIEIAEEELRNRLDREGDLL